MTWGLGCNVLPIILLSVKFMIVLLSEKSEKRIYDYSVVESLRKISVQRLLKAASEKNGHIRPPYLSTLESTLWLFTIYKLNGRRLFGSSFQRKISGSNGTSENSDGIFQTEVCVPFLQTIFDSSFRPSRSFSDKWN